MRRKWLMWPVVLVGGFLLGLALLREYRLRREVELAAENQYQRAFQEVVYHLDGLEVELGKALVSGSPTQTSKAFADGWRHAESARAAMGQLPLSGIPLSATEDFLGQVAAFTYTLSQRGASGKTFTDQEWDILKSMRERAKFAVNELARMGKAFATGAIRWTDFRRDTAAAGVAAATAARSSPVSAGPGTAGAPSPSSQMTKSFKMLEDGMTRFPSPDLEGVLPPPRRKLPAIPGRAIDSVEAARIAADFIGPDVLAGRRPRVVGRLESEPEAYRVEVPASRGRTDAIYLDVSVRGGRVLWMMDESPAGPVRIPPAAAHEIAARFLASRGFEGMIQTSSQVYQGVVVVGFVYRQDDVLVYPDHVLVRVLLDSGRVSGLEATNYQVFHRLRARLTPRVSEAAARAAVNPRLSVASVRLAVIMDDFYQEKLVYEFRGEMDEETYSVYVNAHTGEEEEVKRITPEGTETT